MSDERQRQRLSPAQVVLMQDVLAGQPESVLEIADRVAQFEPVSQPNTDALASVLMDAMDARGYDPDGDINDLGLKLDDLIGVVYQMSEDFFR